ncbi:MAG TPA: carbohydrate-binding domain-containing protein [Candidatus Mediterraneibacter cottocaccae]|nr:carbohydrate-binding domain-containing protein [Candidatus Mediterraneibacter cottocaccae]
MENPGRGGQPGSVAAGVTETAAEGASGKVTEMAAESASGEAADDSESSTSMKGLKAGTGMLISDGTFTVNSADDSVHSNASVTVNGGTFEIATGDDAFHADETLTVTAGTIHITESYEGLEGLQVDIQGGDISLTASDDGLNAAGGTDSSGTAGGRDGMFGGADAAPGDSASGGSAPGGSAPGGSRGGAGQPGTGSSSSNGSITISGGTLYIAASGDGIDANGTLEISGGYTVVTGPTQGDTATLDYDVSAVITGGTFIGTGASGMAQTFSSSEQGVISISAGTRSAGTQITLTDAAGNELISYTPELDFNVVILSSPDIVSGETYTITVGESSGEFEAE